MRLKDRLSYYYTSSCDFLTKNNFQYFILRFKLINQGFNVRNKNN